MGFGLLIIGYFLVNVTTLFTPFAFAMPVGFLLMAMATLRLTPYHSRFRFATWLSFLGVPFGAYYTLYALKFLGILSETAFLSGTVFAAVEWCYFVLSLLLQVALLSAVSMLATDLSLLEMQSNAVRNLVFVLIYHLFYLLSHLPFEGIAKHAAAFTLPVTLLRFLCVFLNVWLFFRCYRNILPEGSDVLELDTEETEREGEKTT